MIIKSMNKNIFSRVFFGVLILALCFLCQFQAQATLAPRVYVTELKTDGIKDNQTEGQFTVWNNEDYYLSDLNYEIKLFKGTDFLKLQLIDLKVSEDTFFVSPNGKTTKSFTYQYPKNIISGDYTLRVQVITNRGSELGWKDQEVSLQGGNKFLEITSGFSRVLVGEKEFYPQEGVNISSDQEAVGFLKVKNLGDAITSTPNIKIFKRQFNMPLVKEYQDSPVIFAKGETKDIKLTMPRFDASESYLAEVKFLENNEQVSGIQYFRWVVRGEGGKILSIRADKDYFKAGDNNLIIETIGPADNSDIGSGKLEVAVFDKEGNLIAQTSKEVELNWSLVSSSISIPVAKDLISPTIEVKLTKDGKILDEQKINLPLFSEEAKQIERQQKQTIIIYLFLALAILLILIGASAVIIKSRIKKQ